jgi:hypothetical protein
MTNKTKIVFAAAALVAAFAAPAFAQEGGVATWFPHSASRCISPADGSVWFPNARCINEQGPVYALSPRSPVLLEGRSAPVREYARSHHRGKRESLVRAN